MDSKPFLTILLAAGSTLDLGLSVPDANTALYRMPSTDEFTQAVLTLDGPLAVSHGTAHFHDRNHAQSGRPPFEISRTVPVLKILERALKAEYDNVDFELVLHALEQLETYAWAGRHLDMRDPFRPALSAFTRFAGRYRLLDSPELLSAARQAVILKIVKLILERKQHCGTLTPSGKLAHFLRAIGDRFSLHVFTLNYDDLADEALPNAFDGFEGTVDDGGETDLRAFSPGAFARRYWEEPLVLAHPHGSVRFGYSLQSTQDELVRYDRPCEALESLQGMSVSDKISYGSIVSAAPIISGLHKAAKLVQNPVPYGYYFRALMDSLVRTPRLLVVGYGGRDDHVNAWLSQFARIHNAERRVVWISKLAGDTVGQRLPEKDLLRELTGPGNWQEYKAWCGAEDGDFQTHGAWMRLVASGFPPANDSLVNRIIEFLMPQK